VLCLNEDGSNLRTARRRYRCSDVLYPLIVFFACILNLDVAPCWLSWTIDHGVCFDGARALFSGLEAVQRDHFVLAQLEIVQVGIGLHTRRLAGCRDRCDPTRRSAAVGKIARHWYLPMLQRPSQQDLAYIFPVRLCNSDCHWVCHPPRI
jgi:hypothetical protein